MFRFARDRTADAGAPKVGRPGTMLRYATSRVGSIGPRAVISIHARALAAPLAADAVAGAFGGDFNNGRGWGALTSPGLDDNPIARRFPAAIHTTSIAASSSSSSSELLPVRPELLPATSDDANGLVRGMSPAQRTAMLSALLRAEHGD